MSPYYPLFEVVGATRGLERGLAGFNAHSRVLRTDKLKYIWSSDGGHRLYDVIHDPLETTNLASREPELANELHTRLSTWWAAQPRYRPRDYGDEPVRPLDEQTIEQLKALGYIGQFVLRPSH